jgi:hypothetical protein
VEDKLLASSGRSGRAGSIFTRHLCWTRGKHWIDSNDKDENACVTTLHFWKVFMYAMQGRVAYLASCRCSAPSASVAVLQLLIKCAANQNRLL